MSLLHAFLNATFIYQKNASMISVDWSEIINCTKANKNEKAKEYLNSPSIDISNLIYIHAI